VFSSILYDACHTFKHFSQIQQKNKHARTKEIQIA
jgi:hypothetical protein